ncbi:MAG: hypothetical protein COU47_04380 [Candidatus Niyogibacteria bacterium CG10_big_fil_rev_8_21_14_0_10_46_36]|uniref:Calcineurin-like phosphoesterase domain-containing protein n=1 Tax=Candidatus Niyogibacteria bacterium CG10_big_fil_rev_8_21_14_0_10_46_36 TaxID=1974726 RepID=A0A2H0TCL1_9BACT|nr:MAG: hypothetical protein COU47_04380 [Candidatus Niyogibacteria bacterium CG10_big_fil_rev_8_21_14_0_10_46_36]
MDTREKRKTYALLFSDSHIGSDLCRARYLHRILKQWECELLIIVGDLFDHANLKSINSKFLSAPRLDKNPNRLHSGEWKLLDEIRRRTKGNEGIWIENEKITNKNPSDQVIWVEGNHDEGLMWIMPFFLGTKAVQAYSFSLGEKEFLVIHGHQFDDIMTSYPWLTEIACIFYRNIQRLDMRYKWNLSRFFKHRAQRWKRITEKVEQGSSEYAHEQGATHVICGHTHFAEVGKIMENGVVYLNTGSWTEDRSAYITIDHDGEVHLWEVETPD